MRRGGEGGGDGGSCASARRVRSPWYQTRIPLFVIYSWVILSTHNQHIYLLSSSRHTQTFDDPLFLDFFTRNTPTNFAPPSARHNFLKKTKTTIKIKIMVKIWLFMSGYRLNYDLMSRFCTKSQPQTISGRREICWGISCEKITILRQKRKFWGYFVVKITILRQKKYHISTIL
jgi:hypothetical protein